ncbi:MAG: LysR family transcriptional regulator [Verrucomicrobia bacterium]|nr:LysR family transcriptional regulator [Verrucomicrobiota bacterium]
MQTRWTVDWDDLRFLLAVARGGSYSAAARTLGVTQPTVGRRIAAFEKHLGARLLGRTAAGLSLTGSGQQLRAHAERMEREAHAAEAATTGHDEGLEGPVRITASEWVARSVLGPLLAPFLERHPRLVLHLVADARHLNLARREADIAIRPSRFRQQEVYQREIAAVEFALYASDHWLARNGPPDFARGCPGAPLIAMSEEMTTIVDVDWLPRIAANARVVARVNGREAMATLSAAGLGLVCLPRLLGDATPGLRLLRTPGPLPRRKLWLGVHGSARAIPRVKATLDHLRASFGDLRDRLQPGWVPAVRAP